MKKHISLIAAILPLLFASFVAPVALVGVAAVSSAGCITSKASKAFTSIKTLEAQVVTALNAYADKSARVSIALNKHPDPSGQALATLLSNDSQVDAALKVYQMAAEPMREKLKASLSNDTDPASSDALAAGNKFITIANTLAKQL